MKQKQSHRDKNVFIVPNSNFQISLSYVEYLYKQVLTWIMIKYLWRSVLLLHFLIVMIYEYQIPCTCDYGTHYVLIAVSIICFKKKKSRWLFSFFLMGNILLTVSLFKLFYNFV